MSNCKFLRTIHTSKNNTIFAHFFKMICLMCMDPICRRELQKDVLRIEFYDFGLNLSN